MARPAAPLLSRMLLALLFAGSALAQVPGLPGKAEPAAEPTPSELIGIADIPDRLAADQRSIEAIIERSAGFDLASVRPDELTGLGRNAEQLARKAMPASLQRLPISGLTALERHLFFLDNELGQWRNRQQAQSKSLSVDAARLAELKQHWAITEAESSALMVPALRTNIAGLLSQISIAERAVSQPLAAVLKLSRQAETVQVSVARSLSAVRDRIEIIDKGLWQIDSAPLHVALADRQASPNSAGSTLVNGVRTEMEFAHEYDRASKNRVQGFSLLAFLLLPIFLWLSRQASAAMASGGSLADYRHTLTRPVSAWLLLTIMGLLLLQFGGPILRMKLLLIIAWLPVMRLQPKHLLVHVGNWAYLTAVFFLINLFSQLLINQPLWFRLTILLNDVLILTAMAWLLYRSVQGLAKRRTRMLLAMRAMAVLGCGLMVFAIAANLIGNVTLAAMLTDATLDSAYLGLFLFAVGTVVRAFTRFLFRSVADKLKSSTQHGGGLMEVVSRLFNFALVITWLIGTLSVFRMFRPLLDAGKALSAFSLGYGNVSVTLGGIVLFVLSVYLSFWLAKTIRGVLAEDVLPNMALPRGVANSVSSLSYYALLLAGLVVALAAAGFHLSQLALVLGALSVGIGLGLQDVVKNFVSGLILMVERPVQPGDIAEVSGTIGKVREIGMRATTLTTFEGADVIVPNGMLLSEKMINWTLSSDKRRIEIALGVAYGTDPQRVLDLLLQVAESAKGVARVPSPTVVFSGFGQSTLDFSIRAWTDNYDDAVFVRSALAVDIHRALINAGISIPYPQRDLHIRSIAPEALKPAPGV
jgi:potassium-dependent mechanosensitive channel